MPRIIKRYENRKLYDTVSSAYVSLSDIADLVRKGETVQVLDNKTGKDLTAQTLTHIILEEGKRGKAVIPTDLLHDLLRRSEVAIDSGIEQLKHGVDDLVQGSISRLNQVISKPRNSELQQLRAQLGNLETLLSKVLDQDEEDAPAAEKSNKSKQ